MSDVTEIYVCKAGQALKEGKLEHSSEIAGRDQAEADAIRRCRSDPTIARIAYYAVDGTGKFRNLYSYENLKAAAAPGSRSATGGAGRAAGAGVRRTAPPPSLLQRFRAMFEED